MRLEHPGDRDLVAWFKSVTQPIVKWATKLINTGVPAAKAKSGLQGFWLRPMLIDGYVLNTFLFYLCVLLVALVALIEVFTFFELLGDMIKNNIGMPTMVNYLWNLAPSLIYQLTPIGTLVASLICFGILTKYNEVTAFKAGGVSVHRLAAPVVVMSLLISALLFAFDHYYIPEANRRQEMLRAQIKNKPVATYLRADRHWVYGQGSRIYNFNLSDPRRAIMSKVNVYDLDPSTFHVTHQISAERAQWSDTLHAWVFEDGMSHETSGGRDNYKQFYKASATFPELTETPSWFVQEEKEYKEMNFAELGPYIRKMQAAGWTPRPCKCSITRNSPYRYLC